MKRLTAMLLTVLLVLGLLSAVSAQETGAAQTDLCLTVGSDESQMNVTWYADTPQAGTLLLAEAERVANGVMPADAARFQAVATLSVDGVRYSNQTTVTGLKDGTAYAYQLLNGDTTSPIYTFTTAPAGDFSFAFVGDPQIGAGELEADTQGWYHTLDLVAEHEVFQDTAFLLTAGDHVNKAENEEQFAALLSHSSLTGLPLANVIGNHEDEGVSFSQHFNLPNASARYGVTAAGGDAWFVYHDVLFILLNSNDRSTQEHRAFMEEALALNPDEAWRIVALHHSLYTVGKHASDSKILSRRAELVPLFDELGIDLVLMGHDHVYCRSYLMDGLTPITADYLYEGNYSAATNPGGVLYITANSGSGSKTYDCEDQVFPYAAAQNQEHVPNVSKIAVTGDSLTITTYRTTDMTVVDRFTICRDEDAVLPFEDVKTGDWFYAAVEEVYTHGIMNGSAAALFAPDDITTRAMVVTILYRMEGKPTAAVAGFSDVESGRYYSNAVAWAAETGIVKGYEDGTFRPDGAITREELVTMLCRYSAWKGADPSAEGSLSAFPDGDRVHTYAQNAMIWAVGGGLLRGYEDGTLQPTATATRAQTAQIIARLRQHACYERSGCPL